MAALTYAGRRLALTAAWGPGGRRAPRGQTPAQPTPRANGPAAPAVENPATPVAPAGLVAGKPATLTGMPKPDGRLTFEERAKVANAARQAAMTDEERSEAARKASQSATGPLVRARQLAKGWATASEDDRREIRRVLREAGIIR